MTFDRIIAVAKLDTDPDSSGMADLRTAYPQLDFIFDRLAELEVRDTLAVALAGEVRGLEDQVLDQQDEIGRHPMQGARRWPPAKDIGQP